MAETATSLKRGLAVLFALGESGELGVTRIAEVVGREKSQVSRTLQVLSEGGLVDRDPDTRAYRLGWRLFALAARAADPRLAEAAPGKLRALVGALGEGAHLSVLRGTDVLTVLSESPPHAVQAVNWAGRTVPAACTSAGYALLVDHSPDELRALVPEAAFGALEDRLAAARLSGYALADEDFEPGLVAVAAPVRDFRGRVVAAVNVSAPKFRFADRLDEAGAHVREAAHDLSREVGWDSAGAH
jgi:IclR family transcriptional regulator, KDG regulon repressor